MKHEVINTCQSSQSFLSHVTKVTTWRPRLLSLTVGNPLTHIITTAHACSMWFCSVITVMDGLNSRRVPKTLFEICLILTEIGGLNIQFIDRQTYNV